MCNLINTHTHTHTHTHAHPLTHTRIYLVLNLGRELEKVDGGRVCEATAKTEHFLKFLRRFHYHGAPFHLGADRAFILVAVRMEVVTFAALLEHRNRFRG